MARGKHGPTIEQGNGPIAREMRESLQREQQAAAGQGGVLSERKRSEFEAKRLGISGLIPSASEFGSSDFLEVESLGELRDQLVREYEELGFLDAWTVRVLWKASGGGPGSRPKLGKCTVASGLVQYFGLADWVVWLAADHCRQLEFSDVQVEALLYHELLHCVLKGEKDPKPAVRPHDFEGFAAEIRRYGFWDEAMTTAKEAVQGRLALDAVAP